MKDFTEEAKRLWAEIEEAAEGARSFAHATGQLAAALSRLRTGEKADE